MTVLDRLIRLLERTDGVDDWKVHEREDRQAQLYLAGERRDAEREVRGHRFEVTVYADGAGTRGASGVTLLPGDPAEWPARLSDAVFRARLQSNPRFALPGRQRYRAVPLVDPTIRERPAERAREIAERIVRLARRERGIRLSSLEVFLTYAEHRFANSQGVAGGYAETMADLEFVLLAGEGLAGTEALEEYGRRRVSELDLEATFERAARTARDSVVAKAPTGGRTAVVFSGEPLRDSELSDFWQPFRFHLGAEAAYRKLSRFVPGRSVTSGRLAGEPLDVCADGTLRYGVASAPFDRDGVALRRTPLVQKGSLARYWASKEYADYLGVEATGQLTNLDVAAGRTRDADLDADGPTLRVTSFSWFNPDPVTGDFSCEIRLGYERRRGRVRPVKGGALQGNLFAAFRAATFSREVEWMGAYHGPRSIRFERLTVGAG